MLDGIPLLLSIAPSVGQIHLAKRAGTDFALDNKRLSQLPE